jgi:hypothetical protein
VPLDAGTRFEVLSYTWGFHIETEMSVVGPSDVFVPRFIFWKDLTILNVFVVFPAALRRTYTLRMKAIYSPERLVTTYKNERCDSPEYHR